MINDIRTMIWKEWSELQAMLLARDNLRGGILTLLLLIAAFSILEPWRIGPSWIGSPIMLFSFILLMPLTMVGTMIPDSFAGERERLTLEPLLATPLSDRAILFGKISAAVGYGWGITLINMVIGLLATNLIHAHNGVLLYPGDVAIGTIGFSLLVSLFVASAGALVSLHAPTARQAQLNLGMIIMLPLVVPAFFIGPFSPLEWKLGLTQTLATMGLMKSALAIAAILVILDIALVLVTLARFHRTQLLLD
jgi:ABC-2 type transport system permease protein